MTTHKIPKLGLKPPNQKKLMKAIPFSRIMTGTVPKHDLVEDHYSLVKDHFQLYKNDEIGDCGPCSVANQRGLITNYLTGTPKFPTQEEVEDLYRRATNPSFNPETRENDNGVVMQELCEELVRGGIGGVKAVAFARVNLFNLDEAAAAGAIFGSLLLGVQLREVQQKQTPTGVWDYRWNSGEWGGHAVLGVGYDETNPTKATGSVVTWAKVVKMTLPFMKQQMSEAWVVIWPENLGSTQFQEGIDLPALQEAYNVITGKNLVLP